MKSNFKKLFLILLQCLAILYLSSCTTLPKIALPNEVEIEQIEIKNKIPLRVGLYLSRDFKSSHIFSYLEANPTIPINDILIGDAISSSSEKIINNIFQEVIILDSFGIPLDSAAKTYDVIITPQLIKLENRIDGSPFNWFDVAQTVIKWDIVSREGQAIYSNSIKSDEIRSDKRWKLNEEIVKETIMLSLKDCFKKAQEDIYKNNWWKKQWWKESNR